MDQDDVLITNEDYSGSNNRTIWQRAFSPISHGSIRGSVFNLCCIAIGAGCLTLPYAMYLAGIMMGMILLVFGACIGYWSLNNLVHTSKVVKSTNYMVVCERAVGKWLGVCLEVIIVLYLLGVLILFQIMCMKIISNKNHHYDS
jgi:amino acid permease